MIHVIQYPREQIHYYKSLILQTLTAHDMDLQSPEEKQILDALMDGTGALPPLRVFWMTVLRLIKKTVSYEIEYRWLLRDAAAGLMTAVSDGALCQISCLLVLCGQKETLRRLTMAALALRGVVKTPSTENHSEWEALQAAFKESIPALSETGLLPDIQVLMADLEYLVPPLLTPPGHQNPRKQD